MTIYGTIEGFTAYFNERGTDLPATLEDETIEPALLVASEWIDRTYGSSFSGTKTGGFLQDREWPRTGAVTNTTPAYAFSNSEIPAQLAYATYEAAYRHISTPGSLLIDYTPNKYQSVRIDGTLSVEYTNFNFASEIQKQFPVINQILSELFEYNSASGISAYSGAVTRT